MTPAQLDHLNRIKRHLETLLANAAKRTPGRWRVSESVINQIYANEKGSNIYIADIIGGSWGGVSHDEGRLNAAFIASCTGNAERGWISTLAAIEAIAIFESQNPIFDIVIIEKLGESILSSWPLESLKQ